MICPQCNGEFVPGVVECPDCGVELTARQAQPPHNQDEVTWVTIAKIASPSELMVVRSMLESSGIPVFVPGEHSFQQIPALHSLRHTTFRGGECELQVPQSRVAEARQILASEPTAPE